MVKHNQTNCLSVIDHFEGLALKGLTTFLKKLHQVLGGTLCTYSAIKKSKDQRLPPLENGNFSKCGIWSTGYVIFLVHRKVKFRSQDIQVFVFLPWLTKSVTSWWVLIHETGCIFEYIFWTTGHDVTKLGHLINISKGNNFLESFEQFGGLGLRFRSFSI